MADNNITIVGNVTREPELRFTANGRSQLTLGIAVNRRYPDRGRPGEWVEETSFFNVVCWADLAENVASSVQKGSRIIVSGRLRQRSWETDNNEKRSVVEVIAEEVGPSLRWATAQISRTERKGPGDFAQSPAPAGAGVPANAPAAGGYDDFGEEPF